MITKKELHFFSNGVVDCNGRRTISNELLIVPIQSIK